MNHEDIIKQLKTITPNADYARRSLARIVGTQHSVNMPSPFTFSKFIAHTIEFGSSIALAGLLIVLVLGGFSILRFLTPLQLSSLNPASLRAEAQAVNGIQLELSNLEYMESMPISTTETAQSTKAPSVKKGASKTVQNQTSETMLSEEALPTVDDILDALAE